ncbi:cation:proton antiporter subunit C [Corynebacterium sp. ES2794-CONJ1]|uniref:cation:proton antiporter subunit C n=1 Tax=unclassified Corynebacterium TaxID=2624378 RepID=UPI0021680F21|nr:MULTISPECIES: cation:proton antiporter subunit C [unclassified Corynebacterium]MCS4490337.1 cation:proton antiporter subunit C [Corynebacterium sp. ES2775-CONJ]MCS4492115.1 cation:proton antiporter subunit C [Corynebacterium sp. ES2715-CONJ3]MCS4532401.1 cation:proton antiporter subunit C [Corynebacterium sp. ES2730-CONJ]MCU9519636.1 cation:proton antiporter subunit C [Corynebacterium sp. ES2794-CONJ1]
MILSATIAILAAGGVYLVLQRGMLRIILGMTLFSHATNLLIVSAGVTAWRGEPFPSITDLSAAADPLPQAFVLTAIVIAMATTTFMLTLAGVGRTDDTEAEMISDEDSPLQTLGRSTTTAEVAAHEAHQATRRRAPYRSPKSAKGEDF